ncbi:MULTISPECIES: extracellular solute-binding protein [unclassified Arthrobacter]|uniref:ABC transporter substrate-binding protein n=1 Tax=unclassified Arthrobacter TaxID=235627 RepID=UPI00288355B8|nr:MULTISPECIES: extracellular solute-binding protein [unclassified Arthrobacter]
MSLSKLRGTRLRSRATAIVGAIGLATFGLTACGGGSSPATSVTTGPPSTVDSATWNKTLDAANQEGTVNWYFSVGSSDKIIADFEKAYPKIKVKATFAGTADLIPKLDQEIEAGVKSADVVVHASPGWFSDRYDADKFASLTVAPDQTSAGWEKLLGGKSYATVLAIPYTISSQSDQPTFTDVASLLAAKPDAKYGLLNPHSSVAAAFAYETLRQEFGDEILDKLAATSHTVEASNTPLGQALGAGSFEYALPGLASVTTPLVAKGARITETVPTKAASGPQYNAAVMGTAPHPNAATVFTNWLMSKDGAASFVKNVSPAATAISVDGSIPWDSVKSYDPKEWTNEKWNAWIAQYWTPRFGG